MTNPIPENLRVGAIGELLTQIRLLQLGVEAFQPLKDTGTDLVAFHLHAVRTIQVKTRSDAAAIELDGLDRDFDLLAVVLLDRDVIHGADRLDSSSVFLVPREIAKTYYRREELEPFILSHGAVAALFHPEGAV